MVLSGSPSTRMYLIQIADAIGHGQGFLTVCSILKDPNLNQEKRERMEKSITDFLKKNEIPALVKVKHTNGSIAGAVEGLCADHGIGAIVPNTYIMGESENEDKFEDFAHIIKTVYAARKNVLIVRQGLRATDDGNLRELHAKKEKRIDLWWGRESKNSNLLLVIGYMIQSSTEWEGANLRVRSLVKDESEVKAVLSRLNHVLSVGRLDLQVDVTVSNGAESLDQIGKLSAEADLVMIGMNPPKEEEGETSKEYAEYYARLIDRTRNFPRTLIALAGEKVDLKAVFSTS